MLHFDLNCGGCDSTLQLDTTSDTYEDTAWLLVQRFMNAHAISCNFATPMAPVSTDEEDEEQGS